MPACPACPGSPPPRQCQRAQPPWLSLGPPPLSACHPGSPRPFLPRSADADFSCFADLALTSPVDYYREGQGSLMQVRGGGVAVEVATDGMQVRGG